MAIKDVLKVSRKTFLNPSGWIDAESIKKNNAAIFTVLKNLFRKDKPLREESFEEAMERMGVTEAEVNNIEVNYRTYSLIFIICGLLVFAYSLYLLFSVHTFSGWLLATSATALFFAQAFRYDFWAFQIKKRKLGCTFAEWKQYRLKG